jgi:hypothetical protein
MCRYARIAVTQVSHKHRTGVTKCRSFSIFLSFKSDFVALVVAYRWDVLCACLPLDSVMMVPSAAVLRRLAVMVWSTIVITFISPRKGKDAIVQTKLGWV